MSPVKRLLERVGYVKVRDYGYQVSPDGRLVPLDDTWAVPPIATLIPQLAPIAAPLPSPPIVAPIAAPLPSPPIAAPVADATVESTIDDDEWEWRMAMARARERLEAETDPLDRPTLVSAEATDLTTDGVISGELTATRLESKRMTAAVDEDAATASVVLPDPLPEPPPAPSRPTTERGQTVARASTSTVTRASAPGPRPTPRAARREPTRPGIGPSEAPADVDDESRAGKTGVFGQLAGEHTAVEATDPGVTAVLARVDHRRPLARASERLRR